MGTEGSRKRTLIVAGAVLALALVVGVGVWMLRSRYGVSSAAPIGTLTQVEARLVDAGMRVTQTDTAADGTVTMTLEGSLHKVTLVARASGALVSLKADLRVIATPDEEGAATVRIVDLMKNYWRTLAGKPPNLPVAAVGNLQDGITAMTSSREDTFQNEHGSGTWTVRELVLHEVVVSAPGAPDASGK